MARGDTVCAYVPVGSEPGSVAMLDALPGAGARVLLPVAVTGDPTAHPLPLLWGEYRPGELVAARFGLLEPARTAGCPRRPSPRRRLVIVPALAVDRRGVRLGRGRGLLRPVVAAARPGRPADRGSA